MRGTFHVGDALDEQALYTHCASIGWFNIPFIGPLQWPLDVLYLALEPSNGRCDFSIGQVGLGLIIIVEVDRRSEWRPWT